MQRIHIQISALLRCYQRIKYSGGHGVRVDTHVYSGYAIPPNYDSMIAKLITTAQTREEAIAK